MGVNDFYTELFRWWSLKPRKDNSTSNLHASSSQEVVDLVEDSGDEGSDLTFIMAVRVKDDPYLCEDDSLGSTVVAESDPYGSSPLDQDDGEIYLVPEYPDGDNAGAVDQLTGCEANGETDHGPGTGDSVASEPVARTDAAPVMQPEKFMTMKDVENRIKKLQQLLGLVDFAVLNLFVCLFVCLLFVLGNVCFA